MTTTTRTTTGTGRLTTNEEFSSSESRKKPEFDEGTVIGGRFTVLSELGRGGCGVVYKVEFLEDGKLKRGALKAEYIFEDYSVTLSAEANILRKLQWSKNVCRMFAAGKLTHDINVIVMSLTGPSLSWLRRKCPQQRFTFSTALRVAYNCMNAIEDLHCTGFIHRDIKASNFTFGYYASESRQIRILDFGFARSYLCYNKNKTCVQIRKPRSRAPFLGTDRYCSPNVHRRLEQGRRDDCWSWMFMLVEFMYGKVPWRDSSDKKILGKKEDALQNLFKYGPVECYQMLDHIQELKYESRPDYDFLRNTIVRINKVRGFLPTDPYDWEVGGASYSRFSDDESTHSSNDNQNSLHTITTVSKRSSSQKAEKFEEATEAFAKVKGNELREEPTQNGDDDFQDAQTNEKK